VVISRVGPPRCPTGNYQPLRGGKNRRIHLVPPCDWDDSYRGSSRRNKQQHAVKERRR
jgi:hypothetical protein